jgi:hypothetical protein
MSRVGVFADAEDDETSVDQRPQALDIEQAKAAFGNIDSPQAQALLKIFYDLLLAFEALGLLDWKTKST